MCIHAPLILASKSLPFLGRIQYPPAIISHWQSILPFPNVFLYMSLSFSPTHSLFLPSAESEIKKRGDCIGVLMWDRSEGGGGWWEWQEAMVERAARVTCVQRGQWKDRRDVRALDVIWPSHSLLPLFTHEPTRSCACTLTWVFCKDIVALLSLLI